MSGQQHRASRCVFVGNIPYDATEEQLVQICEEVGPVVSFRLVVDRDTGKPKGYGFCEFRDEETALSARRNLQGYDINGRQLRVDFAENEKGGGGVDRNRDQGRGGPGFQQSGSHLDSQKQAGGVGLSVLGGGGTSQLEQPIGRGAAAAAALVMAGALGATQPPNMMLQGQSQMQAMNIPPPITGNGGVNAGADALTTHLAGMSKPQLYEIMSQMKIMIQQNQQQARQILVANPQLTKALFQAQIMLGMVRPPQVVGNQIQQAQQPSPPQSVLQQQQQPPRPPQSHALPQMQSQSTNKSSFQVPLQQPQQQQQLQQTQLPPPPQQQQLPPPPQNTFQGGLIQTSLGMAFQQGLPPPPPNQPPPQQLYQMGANMMGANLARMGTNGGGPLGQGNGGILSTGTGLAAGSGQMARGSALGSMDSRGMQLNLGPPASGAMGVLQATIPGGPMSTGHSLVGGNVVGVGGMGQTLSGSLTGSQMLGDPNGRGYAGMNTGINTAMNTGLNAVNPGLNSNLNAGMNTTMNAALNQAMNNGMAQGLNQGYNSGINAGMNPTMNTGLHANMNAAMNANMNQGMTLGLSVPQGGGFAGSTDGISVTTTTIQPQGYAQLQMQAPAPQQQQGQVQLELEQQKALLQQVMNLTSEQIMSLPPDQRQQVLQLQQALR